MFSGSSITIKLPPGHRRPVLINTSTSSVSINPLYNSPSKALFLPRFYRQGDRSSEKLPDMPKCPGFQQSIWELNPTFMLIARRCLHRLRAGMSGGKAVQPLKSTETARHTPLGRVGARPGESHVHVAPCAGSACSPPRLHLP